jgi:hypothetical protein
MLELFCKGTIVDNKDIDFSIRALLSPLIASSIPESVRDVFFSKKEEKYQLELYINGLIEKPSINFSTKLFKLSIK